MTQGLPRVAHAQAGCLPVPTRCSKISRTYERVFNQVYMGKESPHQSYLHVRVFLMQSQIMWRVQIEYGEDIQYRTTRGSCSHNVTVISITSLISDRGRAIAGSAYIPGYAGSHTALARLCNNCYCIEARLTDQSYLYIPQHYLSSLLQILRR